MLQVIIPVRLLAPKFATRARNRYFISCDGLMENEYSQKFMEN
jgi:hypothetical protein